MDSEKAQIRILAAALYEVRQLLSHHIGSTSKENACEAASATLAYALHNEALAIIKGRPEEFDVEKALAKIKNVEEILGGEFSGQLQEIINEIET